MLETKESNNAEIQRPYAIGLTVVQGEDIILINNSMILQCPVRPGRLFLQVQTALSFSSQASFDTIPKWERERGVYCSNSYREDNFDLHINNFEGTNSYNIQFRGAEDRVFAYRRGPIFKKIVYFNLSSQEPIKLQLLTSKVPIIARLTESFELQPQKNQGPK